MGPILLLQRAQLALGSHLRARVAEAATAQTGVAAKRQVDGVTAPVVGRARLEGDARHLRPRRAVSGEGQLRDDVRLLVLALEHALVDALEPTGRVRRRHVNLKRAAVASWLARVGRPKPIRRSGVQIPVWTDCIYYLI